MPVKPNSKYECIYNGMIAFEVGNIYDTDNNGNILDNDNHPREVISELEDDFFLSRFKYIETT